MSFRSEAYKPEFVTANEVIRLREGSDLGPKGRRPRPGQAGVIKERNFETSFTLRTGRTKKSKQPTQTKPGKTSNHAGQSEPKPASGASKSQSRKEHDRLRSQRQERKETFSKAARDARQRAKQLGICRHCRDQAIPGQTRCETCAENHRVARRKNDAERRVRKKEMKNQE